MYEPKNFERLLGTEGFSDVLLRNHFSLYEGYVSNVNKMSDFLKNSEVGTPPWNELKRRFGWEWNGMRLHELYFGNMTKNAEKRGTNAELRRRFSELFQAIEKDFGSFEVWEKDFRATGAMRGIGWAILYYDKNHNKARTNADLTRNDAENEGRLLNVWVGEHDSGHLAGAVPLLVMDVFEHAFATDYGIKRADYITAFWNAIDWGVVSSRFAGK